MLLDKLHGTKTNLIDVSHLNLTIARRYRQSTPRHFPQVTLLMGTPCSMSPVPGTPIMCPLQRRERTVRRVRRPLIVTLVSVGAIAAIAAGIVLVAAIMPQIAVHTTITSEPTSVTTETGNTAAFTVNARGNNLSYRWYVAPKGSADFTPVSTQISGAQSATLHINTSEASNGTRYRVLVTGTRGQTASQTVTLRALTPSTDTAQTSTSIIADPSNATVNRYGTNTDNDFFVLATGSDLSYSWQAEKPNGSWTTISDATSSTYAASADDWDNGTQFRAIVTGDKGTATSSSATLTVRYPTDTPAADAESAFGLSGLTQGVDMSSYQYEPSAQVDTTAIASWAGLGGFAILRNGAGSIPANSSYGSNCTGEQLSTGDEPVSEDCAYATLTDSAQSAGLRLGHYWFNGWITTVDTTTNSVFANNFTAQQSADQFVAWLLADGNYTTSSTDPLVLDIEKGSTWTDDATGTSLQQRAWNADEAYQFLTEVKTQLNSRGYQANLYVYMNSKLAKDESWTNVASIARLWVASWGSNSGLVPTSQPVVGPWSNYGGWSIWQYTSNATIADSNISRLDADIAKSDAWTPK